MSKIAAIAASLGGVLRLQGDIAGAIAATRESLEIRRTLLSNKPNDVDLRTILAQGLYQFGDALKANGQGTKNNWELANAFEAYSESVNISRALVKEHPLRPDLQRLLSIGVERMGTMQFLASNYAQALVLFRETLDIAQRLVIQDRDNLEWAHDLSASHELVGDVLHAQRNLTLAASSYRNALAIRRDIAARDPENFRRQTNIVLLLVRLAMVGDDPRGRWTEALAILRPLKSKLEPVQQGWIPDIEGELAKLTPAKGR
jgi:tetratricopeptide (TPR) repeat protein